MRIEINHNLLSDSPFNESNEALFTPLNADAKNLILDIKNGSPTCYLISGYRGSGKSSFIKRIEQGIKNLEPIAVENSNADSKEVLFVNINFSRYQSQTYLLRKLIRGLYLEIKDRISFKKIKAEELKKPLEERSVLLLEELYEKTFYDTSYNTSKSNKNEVITVLNIDFGALLEFILPGFLLIIFVINLIFKLFYFHLLINIAGVIVTSLLSLKGFINITRNISRSKTEQMDFNRKSMYDDEIADYHFFQILKTLDAKKYKTVFVLDELDKVNDKEIDSLLNEMKPYLVSGAASFIAVAGQNLFYKYMEGKSIDDDVLSSIFSKFIHIPLFSRNEFQNLFENLIVYKELAFAENNKPLTCGYIDYLIFESKKVPRKLISLIRENLVWEDNIAYIEIDQTEDELNKYTQIIDIIEKIDDEEIETEGFEDGLRDYFIMQLYLRSHKILSSKKLSFTEDEIKESDGNGE